ncbi:MAG TPA: hypothetical protein H9903_09125 [Candidatus Aquabacterium excrementipullorum]|nr:hypothetical protein [Candidatus Aquabacterium excrementipullorum]
MSKPDQQITVDSNRRPSAPRRLRWRTLGPLLIPTLPICALTLLETHRPDWIVAINRGCASVYEALNIVGLKISPGFLDGAGSVGFHQLLMLSAFGGGLIVSVLLAFNFLRDYTPLRTPHRFTRSELERTQRLYPGNRRRQVVFIAISHLLYATLVGLGWLSLHFVFAGRLAMHPKDIEASSLLAIYFSMPLIPMVWSAMALLSLFISDCCALVHFASMRR